MTIGVGLAGFGLAGRYLHAPLIRAAGMAVRAVATSRTAEVQADFPDAETVSDFGALTTRGDIDLIVIATPNALHAAQARAALEAGKHVVVDKPVTPTAAEARSLQALADSRGLKLAVYQNRRWDSDFLTVRSLIDGGALGAPARFVNRWNRHRAGLRPERWREKAGPAVGVFYDLGPHLIDQALVLFGMPDWVQADIFHQRGGGEGAPDDGFDLLMAKGNVRIALGAASLSGGPPREIRLDGTDASFVKTGFDVQEDQLRAGTDPLAPGFGVEPAEQAGAVWTPDGEARRAPTETGRWIDFYSAMRRAIEQDGPVPVSAGEAAQTIAVIEAAFESAQTGRRVPLA